MMSELRLPILTNQPLNLKALRTQMSMRGFFDSLDLMGITPEIHTPKIENYTEHGVKNEGVDLKWEGVLKMISQINRLKHGALVIHFHHFSEASYAPIIIQYAQKNHWPVFLFGLTELESQKALAKPDFNFNKIPEVFSAKTTKDILEDFERPLFINQFQQKLYGLSVVPDRIRKEILALFNQGDHTKEEKKQALLLNMVLILEAWGKYSLLVNHLLTTLTGVDKNDPNFQARLVLNLFLQEKYLPQIKQGIFPLLNLDEKETINSLTKKDEFVQYLILLLGKNRGDQFFAQLLLSMEKAIIFPRIFEDADCYAKTYILKRLSEGEDQAYSQITKSILSIRQTFYGEQASDAKQLELKRQEAKKLYAQNLIQLSLSLVSDKFLPTGIKDKNTYAQILQKVVSLPVYSVDRILVNPWLSSSTTVSFVLSRILHQVNFTENLLKDLLLQFGLLLNPFLEETKSYLEGLDKKKTALKEKNQEQALTSRILTDMEKMPKKDFLLTAKLPMSRVEIAIYKDAKIALGLNLDYRDGEKEQAEKPQFGYHQIAIHPWAEPFPIVCEAKWVKELYFLFLKKNLSMLYRRHLIDNLQRYSGQIAQPLYFFLHQLLPLHLYFGYKQLVEFLLGLRIIEERQYKELAYDPKGQNLFAVENRLGLQAPWQNNALAGPLSKEETPAVVLDRLFEDQQAFANQFKRTMQEIFNPAAKESHWVYVKKFLQILHQKSIYNLFHPDAKKLLPLFGPLERVRNLISEHFQSHFSKLQSYPLAFIVSLPEEWEFLAYFCDGLYAELEIQDIPILFYPAYIQNYAQQVEWKKDKLFLTLQSTQAPAIQFLKEVWKILLFSHRAYVPLMTTTSLFLLVDLLNQQENKKKIQKLDKDFLTKVDKNKVLAIYSLNPEEVLALIKEPTNQDYLSLKEALDGFYLLEQVKEDKKKASMMLQQLNAQLGLISFIRYASQDLKLFRQNLDRICKMLNKKIADLSLEELGEIDQVIFFCWGLMQNILKEESQVPLRYRYLNQALNNLDSKVDQTYKAGVLNFFKAAHDVQNPNAKMKDWLLFALHSSVTFKTLLEKKNVFFFFTNLARKEDVLKVLDGLSLYKGNDCILLFEQKSFAHLAKDLSEHVDPSAVISL